MTTASFDVRGSSLLISGDGAPPATAVVDGPRSSITGRIVADGTGWCVRFDLLASRWGGPALPPPSGEYRVRLASASGEEIDAAAPLELTMFRLFRAALGDGLLTVGPPVDPAYDSGEGSRALELRYTGGNTGARRLENAVFFESFYGRVAGCNPLAIDREIARVAPGVTRYWSVIDRSVAVPDGAVAVVDGSPEWWRARGAARLLVVNDWLRRPFVRRDGQQVVQTWHGTPLKRLALHRPGIQPRRWAAVVRESLRWNVLLAQNPYAARVLRKAYAYIGGRPLLDRRLWVEGYPRNDVLTTGDGAAVRDRLGVGRDERVLLYAPTWRDDREEIVDFIDPQRLAAERDAVVLVRGHTRTLLPGRNVSGPRVIDVTAYPDTSELLLAADALITDYSSIMFDFSVTGKPMYFLVPDFEHYRGRLRGFYFDLVRRAPGPVVRTYDELVSALDGDPAEHAEAYDAWRRQFNALDDGRASERVVARMIDAGMITP
ncbi:CDP-glycerol glycerophosphotransferase family protein [Microbacterium halophytorum]|uniref:CDP-glycerol glycerophosphotransferase family protein n=1 Tax=Microbacterium halophytorum TaxID=2067568 RepID=UPI000CFB30ED|nr:CDP-glycerol glycerophosphotransferase family protein [Microbacterium halophytorum]